MDDQPSFNRGLLLPIGIGIFSLMGICVILFAGRMTSLRATVEEVPTSTAFQYALIGTEPVVLTVTADISEEQLPTFTPPIPPTPPGTQFILFPTSTNAPLITLPPLVSTNTPTRTPITASTAPLGAGTYDDLYNQIIYNGDWVRQSNVQGTFQNTLHVSSTLGNSLMFRFIGQEVRVFFQAGPSLGTIRLSLDGTNFDMSQAVTSTQIYEWVLPTVTVGTHTVTITHLSGGSVNLDSIIIPEVPTTPTKTATTSP